MLKNMKIYGVVLLIVLLSCFTTLAATSPKIDTVTVGFNEEKEEPGIIRDAEPSVKGSYCTITDYSCSHDYDDWKLGNKVTFTVVVEPAEDRFFSKNSTTVKVSGKNAELASSKVTKTSITLKINYWPSMTLEDPKNLIWDDDKIGSVAWDKVAECDMYEVKVSVTDENDKTTNKTVSVEKPTADLSSYMELGEVTFSVRAVPKTKSQKMYLNPSDWVGMNDRTALDFPDTVEGTFTDKKGNITFVKTDGTTASGLQTIQGFRYYFEPSNKNIMVEYRWMYLNDRWYYFGADGVMETGWAKVDDYWYYFERQNYSGEYGVMQTGWLSFGPSGPWYYLNDGSAAGVPVGANLRDCVTPDGYTVDKNGVWYTK